MNRKPRVLTRQITVRLSESELDAWTEAAWRCRVPLGHLVRYAMASTLDSNEL